MLAIYFWGRDVRVHFLGGVRYRDPFGFIFLFLSFFFSTSRLSPALSRLSTTKALCGPSRE